MDEPNPWQSPSQQELGPKTEVEIEWKGRSIKVSAEFVPQFFPLRDQFAVFVDGSEVVCQRIPSSNTHQFSFSHEATLVHGWIESSGSKSSIRKFLLQIEGDWTHGHRVIVKRWRTAQFVGLFHWLVLCGLLLILLVATLIAIGA